MKNTILKFLSLFIIALLLQSCAGNETKNESTRLYKYLEPISAPLGFDYQEFYKGDMVFDHKKLASDLSVDEYSLLSRKIDSYLQFEDWEQLAYQLFFYQKEGTHYFYLGLAAENLGHPVGALKYYRKSLEMHNSGYKCKDWLYDFCRGYTFPEDMNIAISRAAKIVDHLYRPREVEISVKQDNALIMVDGGSMFESPHVFKLTPGEHKVILSIDTAIEEKTFNLSADIVNSTKMQFEINEDPGLSLSVNYFEDVNKVARLQKDRLEASGREFGSTYTVDDLPFLIDSMEVSNKQLKGTKDNLSVIIDKKSSLYQSAKENALLQNQLLKIIKHKIKSIKTQDIFEHIKLSEALSANGIETQKIDLFIMGERLKGRDFLNARRAEIVGVCNSYVMVTKGGKVKTDTVDTESSQYSSEYIGEYRDEPNPRYSQLKSELRQARYEMESSRIEHSNTNAAGLSPFAAILTGIGKGMLESKHQENVDKIQARLSNTSRLIRREIKTTYYLNRKNVTFSKHQEYEWLSINCNSGQVNTHKVSDKQNNSFVLYEGIRNDDLNNLKESNQDTKERMRDWSKSHLVSLRDIESNNNRLLSTDTIQINTKSVIDRVNKFLLPD